MSPDSAYGGQSPRSAIEVAAVSPTSGRGRSSAAARSHSERRAQSSSRRTTVSPGSSRDNLEDAGNESTDGGGSKNRPARSRRGSFVASSALGLLGSVADGIRTKSASVANRIGLNISGSESDWDRESVHSGHGGHAGHSADMDDVEEEDEGQIWEMMNSMERRQTTDPRLLALASVGRKSRKALKHQGDAVRGDATAMYGRHGEAASNGQRIVHMNSGDDPEFQEARKEFASNRVKTAKYNPISFFPLFLFEMFSRAAYFYFLCQACLSWWDVVSPLGGAGATMALVFVLGVSGVKAVAEDRKRHKEDRKTNTSTTRVLKQNGSQEDVLWEDVVVGDIVVVKDDELIPADILCLHVPMKEGVCYIKTTNLDGESNLKIKRPVPLDTVDFDGPDALLNIRGVLECEKPNADLHTFKGCFSCETNDPGSTATTPITMNEVLLRGCILKNSGYVYGLVIYTGDETRIQQNAAKTPFKVGAYDTFLNLQIGILMALQAAFCVFGSIMATTWRQNEGSKRFYLGADHHIQGNYESPVLFGVVTLLTYWIILSYMVPISLFVTMEIVKFWQGFMFINMDPCIVDPDTLESAKCRNSNLMEDLGKVEYVFSDKTGTLTTNEMRLRQVAVKGTVFGSLDLKLEDHHGLPWEKVMAMFDKKMLAPVRWLQKKKMYVDIVNKGGSSHHVLRSSGSKESISSLNTSCHTSMESEAPGSWIGQATRDSAFSHPPRPISKKSALPPLGSQAPAPPPQVLAALHQLEAEIIATSEDGVMGLHLVDFWLNVCICHSLLVEEGPNGEQIYQGPSPDEVALVEAARQLGYVFVSRDVNSIQLKFQGVPLRFELLNVIEFSSDRKRMSVVARCPDGTVRLFCKGADNAILGSLTSGQEGQYMEVTDRNLRMFAQQGLRTLALGTKVIPIGAYRDWDMRFQAASSLLDGREEQMAKLQDEVEQDLELVGITAIEDKLQNGVPEAIATLLEAGIKVWMITGDKQETAINIATSCRLLKQPERAMIFNSDSYVSCKSRLRELMDTVDPVNAGRRQVGSITSPQDLMMAQQPLLDRNNSSRGQAATHELVIDGHTLTHILGTNIEPVLAELGSYCASVVVCRASPSQKACIVKLMRDFEYKMAVRGASGLLAWKRKFEKRITGKMLSIGDGANDVAMIQAADVGIGIMGKEGRQAVNNSDFAIAQFRFLIRLLLCHGQVSDYRLSNLIVYSFYKNMCFASVLFIFQFFCAYSGQTLVDDMTAAAFNVVFTSAPILLFSVLDRQASDLSYLAYPQTYNKQHFLGTQSFWRRGVLHGTLDGLCSFLVPYLAANPTDMHSVAGLFCLGKTCFFALLGSVTLEVVCMTKFWNWLHAGVVLFSYLFSYIFVFAFPEVLHLFGTSDPAQEGVAANLLSRPSFFLTILAANLSTLGFRVFVKWMREIFVPSDSDLLALRQKLPKPWADLSWQACQRLEGLGIHMLAGGGDQRDAAREDSSAESGRPGSSSKKGLLRAEAAVPHSPASVRHVEMRQASGSH
mmetsp:Transcript_8499/g.24371  ORF Transcript_8499/g.24371 Transcript_8499/m.24371 type:complete len:1512 (+) Transcript_8499:120-4655(+)